MPDNLPKNANLEWLRKSARQLQKSWREQGSSAKLADAQYAVAKSYGFKSWRSLKRAVDVRQSDKAIASRRPEQTDPDRFLRSVGEGDEAAVRLALRQEPSLINAIGAHPFWGGRPQALHVAVETNREDMIALLLSKGADPNGSNSGYDNWSPLMLALSRERPSIRNALIQAGAHVGLCEALLSADDDALDNVLMHNADALHQTVPSGSLLALARTEHAIVRLLALGVSPAKLDRWGVDAMEALSRLGPKGSTLLAALSRHGNPIRPEELARIGDARSLANLAETDPETVLADPVFMAAVDFGHHDIVRWMLHSGANPNARSPNGSHGTALHSASWNGDLQMARILFEAGADLAARDKEHDNTPLGWANVSRQVTNNVDCDAVASFLQSARDSYEGRHTLSK